MPRMVTPRVFLVGYSTYDIKGLTEYLEYTGQTQFLEDVAEAVAQGVHPGEIICSICAKLCYKALVVDGRNLNVKKIRNIKENIQGCFDQGHGSVFEHCYLNFVVTDCSRVYTHEQVRHRVGWGYSQTSGRYCRADCLDLVLDPLTKPVNDEIMVAMSALEVEYKHWCDRMGLNGLQGIASELAVQASPGVWKTPPREELIEEAKRLGMKEAGKNPDTGEVPMYAGQPDWEHDFNTKKLITSALRRPLPNGQGNEIGMSVNIRALRQTVQLRTAAGAEWEIRNIYNQIYDLVKPKFPSIFYRAKTRERGGQREIYGMKTQPFEILPGDPRALEFWEVDALQAEIARR